MLFCGSSYNKSSWNYTNEPRWRTTDLLHCPSAVWHNPSEIHSQVERCNCRLSCFKRMVSLLDQSGDGCAGATRIAHISHHGGPVQRDREKKRRKHQVLLSACHPATEEQLQCKKVHAEPESRLTSFSWAGCNVVVF